MNCLPELVLGSFPRPTLYFCLVSVWKASRGDGSAAGSVVFSTLYMVTEQSKQSATYSLSGVGFCHTLVSLFASCEAVRFLGLCEEVHLYIHVVDFVPGCWGVIATIISSPQYGTLV